MSGECPRNILFQGDTISNHVCLLGSFWEVFWCLSVGLNLIISFTPSPLSPPEGRAHHGGSGAVQRGDAEDGGARGSLQGSRETGTELSDTHTNTHTYTHTHTFKHTLNN